MALEMLGEMDELGPVVLVNMYRSLLKACADRKSLAQARQVHSHLMKHGLESTRFLGEYAVSTLVKCGGLAEALHVFERLPNRTAFSWTAVLNGYSTAEKGRDAHRFYQRMRDEGVVPNKYTFLSLLKACGGVCDLQEGSRIRADIVSHGYEGDLSVATGLVDMFAKCGCLEDARNVFDGLPVARRNVVMWNAMLAAYGQKGNTDKALQLFESMREQGVEPNDRTFVRVLHACGILAEKEKAVMVDGQLIKMKALERGQAIHGQAHAKGYDSDVFVGNTLISMYGKCGSTARARKVFDGLSGRDVVSWNAMIATCLQQDGAEQALQLYEQMQEQGFSPNDRTFVSVIPACGILAEKEDNIVSDDQSTKQKYLERGKAIHHDARMKGYDADVFIGSALVSMYAKCGSIKDAEGVFYRLFARNVVAWNAMLGAYTQYSSGENALQFYKQMREAGVLPDNRTFVAAIQACALLAEEEGDALDRQTLNYATLQKGRALHADAQRSGYDCDVFVGNILVSMYGKCGSISDGQRVFDGLSDKNVVSWNTMLATYVEQNEEQKALQLYEQMCSKQVSADDRTFVTMLQACGMLADKEPRLDIDGLTFRVNSLAKAKVFHAEAWRRGYSSDVFVNNTLVSVYGKCKNILDAENVFRDLSQHSLVSWNSMLAAHVEQDHTEKALLLYEQMLDEGVSPDVWTFVSTTQACGTLAAKEESVVLDVQPLKLKSLQRAKAIHSYSRTKGDEMDLYFSNTLVTVYGKCGSVLDAQKVFQGLRQSDVVSWNAMIAAYAQNSDVEKALVLYRQMKEVGVQPDDVTTICILQACSNSGSLDVCRQIHNTLANSAGKEPSLILSNTLIHSYGACSSMRDAQIVFDGLRNPDVVSWTALVSGYARQGDSKASLEKFEDMLLAGSRPNAVTFLAVLSACSHAGLVDRGLECFESMTRVYGLSPGMEHYVCMVDLLGRAGYFTTVETLLSMMPMQPSLSVWLCLLGACRKHGEAVLAKRAFDCAVHLEPKHPAAYVLMWNIYVDAGLWEHANEVARLREQGCAWKKPGQSWIEHEQELHSFVVGDQQHSPQQHLFDLVRRVNLEVEQGRSVLHSQSE